MTRRRSTSIDTRTRICHSASAATFCLGVHLARLEGKVFFEELLDSFATIELTGEPVRIRSNLNNTLKRLPVRLSA